MNLPPPGWTGRDPDDDDPRRGPSRSPRLVLIIVVTLIVIVVAGVALQIYSANQIAGYE